MDQQQRKLERAASAGDVEAEAELLLQRVRSGGLSRSRLELASQCGHQAAIAATGCSQATLAEYLQHALREQELETAMRILVAVVRGVSTWRDFTGRVVAPEEIEDHVSPVEDWLIEPTESKLAALAPDDLCKTVAEVARNFLFQPAGADRSVAVLALLPHVLCAPTAKVASFAAKTLLGGVAKMRSERMSTLGDCAAELVPWALGTGDAVRDRVEARAREAAG